MVVFSFNGVFGGVNPNRVFINQLSSKKAGHRNQGGGQGREIQTPGKNDAFCALDAKQPIERCQREQHDREYGMTPGTDQATNPLYENQIQQSNQTGEPASERPNTGEPEASPSPEAVAREQVPEIASRERNQRCNRKMDQHRVQRVTSNSHATVYRGNSHKAPFARRVDWNGIKHSRPCLSRLAALRSSRLALEWMGASVVLAGCSGEFSSLDPASQSVRDLAWLWWGMLIVSVLVLVGIVGVWCYAFRRRARPLSEAQALQQHRRWLIGGGLVLPMVSIVALLAFGTPIGHRMMPFLEEGETILRIDVIGHQWWWEVHYPDDRIGLRDELHIPVDTPVNVHLTSADVVHSFWVPRLAGKLDLVPGRTNVLRLQADEPGLFRGQCAEFCGLGHAHMHFTVRVHSREEFENWRQAAIRNE